MKPNKPTMEDLGNDFDKKFRDRFWQIIKKADPISYAIAETNGLFDAGGPQIYGEIKQFIKDLLAKHSKTGWNKGFKEGVKRGKIVKMLNKLEEKVINV